MIRAIAFDDSRLLDTWDRAAVLDRPWRELTVLESATGVALDELARLSIGERDRLLLNLRIGAFGSSLHCETTCPACTTRLEMSLDARDLLVAAPVNDPSDFMLSDEAVTVRFRLPDSTDLAACWTETGEPLDAARVIGERCTEVVATAGDTSRPVAISNRLRDHVAERMAALDAQADVVFDLHCVACNHRWQSPFDPAAFLLSEVDAYAARLTLEVHQLARAYGWQEASILAMGATRRRRYLSILLQ